MIDEAFTQVPAYAPRTGIPVVNYPDTGTNYYWAVLPGTGLPTASAWPRSDTGLELPADV